MLCANNIIIPKILLINKSPHVISVKLQKVYHQRNAGTNIALFPVLLQKTMYEYLKEREDEMGHCQILLIWVKVRCESFWDR